MDGTKSSSALASLLISHTDFTSLSVCFLIIRLNIWLNICPNEVLPDAFEPININSFLYLNLGRPGRCSVEIYDFTIFLGYEKFITKSRNAKKLSSFIFMTIISPSHSLITSFFWILQHYYKLSAPFVNHCFRCIFIIASPYTYSPAFSISSRFLR